MIEAWEYLVMHYYKELGRYFGPQEEAVRQLGCSLARWQRQQLLGSSASSSTSASAACTPPARVQRIVWSSSSSDKDCSSEGEVAVVEEIRRPEGRRRVKRRSRSEVERRVPNGGTSTLEGGSVSREQTPAKRVPRYANAGTDDEVSSPEENSAGSCENPLSSASYFDLMEKMRSRQLRRSISRDPSVASS